MLNYENTFFFILLFLTFQTASATSLTILTSPVGSKGCNGHPAVVRSLVAGLKKIGISFNKNPCDENDVAESVVVLSDIQALKQAIQWKQSGKIKKLLAGPNLVTISSSEFEILGSPEIDIILVPSEWVKVNYEEKLPILKGKIQSWYAGVDTDYWRSHFEKEAKIKNLVSRKRGSEAFCKFAWFNNYEESSVCLKKIQWRDAIIDTDYWRTYLEMVMRIKTKVLVYWKTESEAFCETIENSLQKFVFEPVVIKYGAYTANDYKRLVSECVFAVFISASESQGIALAETWAMNIPTLVWHKKKIAKYSVFSPAPYLTEKTGRFWNSLDEFEQLLFSIENLLPTFSPRDWVLEHMTDEHSAYLMMKILKGFMIG